ncbi:response regulator [Aliivibrio kagoshimensis]|uniref:response regulator n=1 Tax=Aliivibrio kagoshimensis TaxID=2910230 RepID=UPI003D0DB5FB
MVAFLFLSITPLTLIALFFLHSHSQDLEQQSTNHLASLRDNKQQQIRTYFQAKESEVLSFAHSELANASGGRFYGLIGAFQDLGFTEQEARENAQQRYIRGSKHVIKTPVPSDSEAYNGSERYRLIHKRYHWAYIELLKRSDFSDVLLVDRKGTVVYSIQKKDNFGTNLLSGKYNNTPLSETYKKVAQSVKEQSDKDNVPVIFSGFNQVSDHQVAWFAAPIIQQGFLHSYVIFELSNKKLTQLIEQTSDLNSGISYLLVGQDFQSKINNVSDSDIELSSTIIINALKGDSAVGSFANADGAMILSAYSPVSVLNQTWALSVELPENQAFLRIQQLEKIFVFAMMLAIILVVIASHYLSNSITLPLLKLSWAAERVSAGDLDQEISSTERSDEIGRLAISFSRMQRSVREKIELIKEQNRVLESNLSTIQHQNDELQLADKLKDEFLATTSHELRTPLHGMVGIAETLISGANGPLLSHQRHQLEIIINSGQRLATLVDDLLDYHKMRYGSLDINKKPVNVSSATRLVLELSQHLIGSKPVRIINQVSNDLPVVLADEQRLEQVLYNLIGNAIKYTSEGKIVISATVVDENIRVQVVDTGHGIPPEQLEHIFEPLIQAGQDSNRYRQGAGLGLSISRQLIELMNGDLYVSSQPMVGATFSFTLPIATDQTLAGSDTDAPHSHFQAPVSSSPSPMIDNSLPENSDGPLLVIADDEPVNLQVLDNFLRLEGYRVKTASDGPETLSLLKEEKPELLLLDVMMPGMSGYEVCQSLRAEYDHAELPIIMLTALNQTQDRIRGFDAGANDYLTKPFNKQELSARINAHLLASKSELRRQENVNLQKELRSREQVEAGLLEAQGYLLEQLEKAPEAIICIRQDNRIKFANDAASKLFKRSSEQLTRYHTEELLIRPALTQQTTHFNGDIDIYIDGDVQRIFADILPMPKGSGLLSIVILSVHNSDNIQRIFDLENAVDALSRYAFDGDKDKLQQLKEMGGEFTRIADKVENKGSDKATIMREILVDVMTETLDYWQQDSGSDKFTLAEQSGLWRVYLDRSTLQTRTLDKYLRVETLPKTPRWRTVLNTIDYVLEHCQSPTASRQRVEKLRDQLQKLLTD